MAICVAVSRRKISFPQKTNKISDFLLESGAPTRTRTADLLITNQLLYQLSYRGTEASFKAFDQNLQEAFLPICAGQQSNRD